MPIAGPLPDIVCQYTGIVPHIIPFCIEDDQGVLIRSSAFVVRRVYIYFVTVAVPANRFDNYWTI